MTGGGGGGGGGGEERRGGAVYFASRRRGEGERGTEGCVLLHNASTQLCAECALRDNRESHERGGREEALGDVTSIALYKPAGRLEVGEETEGTTLALLSPSIRRSVYAIARLKKGERLDFPRIAKRKEEETNRQTFIVGVRTKGVSRLSLFIGACSGRARTP